MGGFSVVILMAALGVLFIFAIIAAFICFLFCVASGIVLLVVNGRLRVNPEFRERHGGLSVTGRVCGILSISAGTVSSFMLAAAIICSFLNGMAAAYLYIISVVAVLVSLSLCIAVGIILLVVSSRISKNPEIKARHRALSIVCKVLGIFSVSVAGLTLGLLTAAVVQVMVM